MVTDLAQFSEDRSSWGKWAQNLHSISNVGGHNNWLPVRGLPVALNLIQGEQILLQSQARTSFSWKLNTYIFQFRRWRRYTCISAKHCKLIMRRLLRIASWKPVFVFMILLQNTSSDLLESHSVCFFFFPPH